MTHAFDATLAYDDGDIDTNRSANPHLSDLIAARYSRRQTLFGGVSAAATAVFGSALLSACGDGGADEYPPVEVSAGANAATTSGRAVTLNATATGNTLSAG